MHTDARFYYATLGVDPAASEEMIRSAFRRRAKELHPDSMGGDSTAFIRLKRAYDTLSNPRSRAAYDRASTPRPLPKKPPRFKPEPPVRPSRAGSGIARYVVVFLFMGGVSLGAIQLMINFSGAQPTSIVHAVMEASPSSLLNETKAGPASSETEHQPPGSSKSGFWDATNVPGNAPVTVSGASGMGPAKRP